MKTMKKALACLLVVAMFLTAAPLNGFVGLQWPDIGLTAQAATITSYSTGDIIEFGWYPQSEVTDADTIAALNAVGGQWISYNYYSGTGKNSDGNMTASDYMLYKDVLYSGNKYRGVVFNSYRPFTTGRTSSSITSSQDDNGYLKNTIYWFQYDPIRWRVLDPKIGMVLSETILDSQAYNNYVLSGGFDEYGDTAYWGNASKTYYANNYEKSSIRKWLNVDFYNTAFSAAQQNIIAITTIDNSACSESYSAYDSVATNDKIYLLSCDDAINMAYGFSGDAARTAQGSAYAKCQGLWVHSDNNNSYWLLRSAGSNSDRCSDVHYDGKVYSNNYTSLADYGIRAALNFKLTSTIFQSAVKDLGPSGAHTHSYTAAVTLAATCCTTGVMTYTCECEDSYTEVIPFDFNNHAGGTEVRDAKEATKDAPGYTGDTYCIGCNTKLADGEEIPYSPVIIASGTCGENLTWTLDEEGTLTISGSGAMPDYTYSSMPWYSNRSAIKNVVLEYGVTTIGSYAFYNCTSLVNITIPDSVTSIGNYAFYNCDSLVNITIPDNVTTIGDYAFYNCDSLVNITIPDSVTTIGSYTFCYCTSLASVTFGANSKLTSIGDHAFYGCDSLVKITIPDKVTSIDENAFRACDILESITVEEDNANYSSDEYGVLFNKDKTSLIQYPIGNARTEYNIPDSVTSIGDYAFFNCDSLVNITIPGSVTSIGDYAFYICYKLAHITVAKDNANYSSDEYGVLFNNDKTSLIQYPIGNARTEYKIPDSVTSIGDYAFYYCNHIESLTLPDSVTTIGRYAFYCTHLLSLAIGNKVTSIGEYAFSNCHSLTSIFLGSNGQLPSIGKNAFFACYSLTSVTISNNVTSIGQGEFWCCYALTSITIPDSVTSIGQYAVRDCTALTEITILNPDCEIYDSAYTIYSGATIYGYTGSTAEEYATKYNRTFVSLGDAPNPHTHSYTGTVTLAPTCCTTGVMTYTCECEDSYTEVIPFDFNNHAGGTEVRNAVKFNCITGGYTGDTYCLGCGNKIADGEATPGTGEHTYEYKTMTEIIEIKGNNKIDLVFVVDTTGSMGSYIDAMKTGMKGYLSQLEAKDIDYRIAIVDYRDFANRNGTTSTDYPYKVQLAFTGNEDSVIAAINALALGNGGDTNETVYSALIDGLNDLTWREDAGKTVILMGDADALDPEPNTGYTLADAVASLKEDYSSPVTLFAIINRSSSLSTFASLASQTGGKCYTSAASLDVSEFVSDIIETIEKTVIIPDSEWVRTKEPTCTEPGEESRTCTVCADVQTRTIPALGHDFVFTTEKDATCTESGYVLYTCTRCKLEKRETIAPYGHDFGSDNICDRCGFEVPPEHEHSYTTTVTPPTCTEMGYTEYSCDCGYSYRSDYIEQNGHAWDDGVVTKEKTCTENGTLIKTCTVCSATRIDPIPASHEWSETIIKEATCTEDGAKSCTCTVCGETKTEVIPAGHTWTVQTITKEATCTEPGKETRICSVCGISQEFDIPALGHRFVDGVCTRCGIGFIDVITKDYANPEYGMYFALDDIVSDYGPSLVDEYGLLLDYNEGAQFDKVAIYLTQDGTMWRRCIACTGSNITRATYVPYLAYNSEVLYSGLNSAYINTFRLSKNASGIWEYSNYATIGVNLQDAYGNLLLSLYDIGQAGAKTRIFDDLDEMKAWLQEDCENHTEEILPGVEPTCIEFGKTEGKWCPTCGQIIVKQEILAKVNHSGGTATCISKANCAHCGEEYGEFGDHIKGSYTEPASCTVNGYTMVFCTECGDELDFVIIPAAHKPGADATCTKDQICTVCGELLTASLGHTPAEAVEEDRTEATCTVDGSYNMVVYCATCGEKLSTTPYTITAPGHIPGTAATCTTAQTCTVCSEELAPALGHTPGDAVMEDKVEATCTVDGSYNMVVYCATCGEKLSTTPYTITAPGHIPGTAATCTTAQTCTVCSEELAPALGHTPGDAVMEDKVEATCTVDGSYNMVVYCAICNEKLSTTPYTITAPGHDYTAVVTPPTCEADGYTTYTCTVCDDSYIADETTAIGHEYENSEPIEPSCIEEIHHIIQCIHCDYEDVIILPKAEHTRVYVSKEATCTTPGYYGWYCEVCGYQVPGATAPLGHTIPVDPQPEYCTDGYVITTCSVCGVEYKLDIMFKEHTWNDWITETQATFETEGLKKRTCAACPAEETESIPVLETKEFEDKDSGVSVETDKDAYGGKDVEVKVEEVFDGSHYLTQSFGKVQTWNIKTYVDGEKAQPDTPVYVRIPLPEGFDPNKTFVYHINSQTGEREKMDVEVIDNYICFFTSSFSLYIVVDESTLIENPTELIITKPYTIAKESADGFAVVSVNTTVTDILAASNGTDVLTATGEKADASAKLATGMVLTIMNGETVVDSMEIAVLGDIDGDGSITAEDARLALRISVELETLAAVYLTAARVSGNATVVSEDAREILRASVGLDDPLAWFEKF